MIYVTQQGDRLDRVCARHYGTIRSRVVERVLDANPGLASLGPVYPEGLQIVLPDLDIVPQKKATVRLWD